MGGGLTIARPPRRRLSWQSHLPTHTLTTHPRSNAQLGSTQFASNAFSARKTAALVGAPSCRAMQASIASWACRMGRADFTRLAQQFVHDML